MDDDITRRFERVEDRISGLETREAGRDVRVEVAIGAMNRLSVLVGGAGLAILGALVTFVLAGH